MCVCARSGLVCVRIGRTQQCEYEVGVCTEIAERAHGKVIVVLVAVGTAAPVPTRQLASYLYTLMRNDNKRQR